jgi:histidinol-phosphatase
MPTDETLDLLSVGGLAAAREVAIAAARAGSEVAMRYFGRNPRVRRKADMSPVTEADIAAEAAIVATVRAAYPEHAFWAEESSPGAVRSSGPTWIVDPIDGTKQYMRGIPFFATLVALALDGEPVVGVSYAPALDELLVATRGGGATCNGQEIAVSALATLRDGFVAFGPLQDAGFAGYDEALRELGRDTLGFRGYGDFYGYHLVARGLAEVMIEPEVAPWDVAALKLIVEEAGGVYSDFGDDRRAYGTGSTGGSVATNGLLHGTVMDALRRHGVARSAR